VPPGGTPISESASQVFLRGCRSCRWSFRDGGKTGGGWMAVAVARVGIGITATELRREQRWVHGAFGGKHNAVSVTTASAHKKQAPAG